MALPGFRGCFRPGSSRFDDLDGFPEAQRAYVICYPGGGYRIPFAVLDRSDHRGGLGMRQGAGC